MFLQQAGVQQELEPGCLKRRTGPTAAHRSHPVDCLHTHPALESRNITIKHNSRVMGPTQAAVWNTLDPTWGLTSHQSNLKCPRTTQPCCISTHLLLNNSSACTSYFCLHISLFLLKDLQGGPVIPVCAGVSPGAPLSSHSHKTCTFQSVLPRVFACVCPAMDLSSVPDLNSILHLQFIAHGSFTYHIIADLHSRSFKLLHIYTDILYEQASYYDDTSL